MHTHTHTHKMMFILYSREAPSVVSKLQRFSLQLCSTCYINTNLFCHHINVRSISLEETLCMSFGDFVQADSISKRSLLFPSINFVG